MAVRLERGFIGTHANPRPPASEKGFEWPSPRAITDAQRAAFRKAFTQLTRDKGLNHRTLARALNGESRDGNGYVIPRDAGSVRKYMDGVSFPQEDRATVLAAFFKVPMQRFLQDDGQPFEPIDLLRPGGAAKRGKKANGHARHAGNGAAGPAVASHGAPAPLTREQDPPPKPPKGAKPVQLEIKTLPGVPDWCQVTITGTVPLDVGLGLMAFIERGTHRAVPRK